MNDTTTTQPAEAAPVTPTTPDAAALNAAAQAADQLMVMLQGVGTIANAMRQVGSLEQACNEARTRHGVLTSQTADLQTALDAKRAEAVVSALAAQVAVDDAAQKAADNLAAIQQQIGAAQQRLDDIVAQTVVAGATRERALTALAEAKSKFSL